MQKKENTELSEVRHSVCVQDGKIQVPVRYMFRFIPLSEAI
jgi:hypothetical protein